MKKTIQVVKQYEECSGQLVNNSKGSFYVHEKMPLSICNTINRRKRMRKGSFPFTYLGCPVDYERREASQKNHEEGNAMAKQIPIIWGQIYSSCPCAADHSCVPSISNEHSRGSHKSNP